MSIASRCYSVAGVAVVTGIVSVASASSAQAALPGGVTADFGTNGSVRAIVSSGGRIYLGGTFSRVIDQAGSHAASNVAAYNPSTRRFDLGFNASTNGMVTALAVIGSRLYLGGKFGSVNGSSRLRLGAVNASSGSLDGFRADTNGDVDDLAVGSGMLYASGAFQTVRNGGNTYTRPFVARLSSGSGQPDGWSPRPNGRVRAIDVSGDGSVFLGGLFSSVSGNGNHDKVSKVTGGGSPVGSFVAAPTSTAGRKPVLSLAVSGDRVVVGAGGTGGGACTGMSASSGGRVWSHRTDGDVQAVEVVGGTTWCGGHFTKVSGANRMKLAAVNAGGGLDGFAITLNSPMGVWAVAPNGSSAVVGGDFTVVNGEGVNRVIAINR